MKVSMVIVTMNRQELLKLCLEHISKSSYQDKEIIVVDGSNSPEIIEANKADSEVCGAAYFSIPGIGLCKGRNLGIHESSGDIIIFVDDDILIKEDTIDNIMPNFDEPKVMACSVRILPLGDNESAVMQGRLISSDGGENRFRATPEELKVSLLIKTTINQITHPLKKIPSSKLPPPLNTGPFCFFAYRREVFNLVGEWDEGLGGGTPAGGAEDVDMAYRVLKGGYDIVYEPKAEVYHVYRPTYEELSKVQYRMGKVGKALIRKYRGDKYNTTLWVGAVLNHIFHMIIDLIKLDKQSAKLEWLYISGWWKGPE
jgi:GT2 family glycosyltransferase